MVESESLQASSDSMWYELGEGRYSLNGERPRVTEAKIMEHLPREDA